MNWITILTALLTLLQSCQAFSVSFAQLQHSDSHWYVSPMFMSVSSTDVIQHDRLRKNLRRDNSRKKKKREPPSGSIQMHFAGSQKVTSVPISISSKENAQIIVKDYFMQDNYRDLLFPNNNATKWETPLPIEMYRTWCDQAESNGCTGPNVVETLFGEAQIVNTKDELASVIKISVNMHFPGLKILSESYIGVKVLAKALSFPEYQFTLLRSDLIPEGNPAVMWTFNQIIKYRDSTSSFTRVTVEDKGGGSIVFVTDARLGTTISIPAGILQFLPMLDIEKYEKQGSNSIQKLLEKDLSPALNNFAESFRSYIRSVACMT